MVALRRFAIAEAFPVLRALIFLLVLPIASVGTLPAWAALFGAGSPHVCHCSVDHHECVCARCHTDPDGDEHPSTETIRGQCGDDAPAVFGAKAFLAIAEAVVGDVAVVMPSFDVAPLVVPDRLSRDRHRPPARPPRHAA